MMTGSEKIIARILEDAKQAAEVLLGEAEQKACAIEAATVQAVKAQVSEIVSEGEKAGQSIVRAAHSAAALTVRNALLQQRRKEIESVLAATVTHLCELPDKDYFSVILTLIGHMVQNGNGILCFNQRDLQRLPVDFSTQLACRFPGKALLLSTEPVDVDGGFILKYDDIEMNAGFSALLEERREELEDFIYRELF